MARRGNLFKRIYRRAAEATEEALLRAAAHAYRFMKERPEHAKLAGLSEIGHAERWEQELADLRIWVDGLDAVTRRAEDARVLFRTRELPGFDDRARLRGIWASFLDYQVAIDRVKFFHAGFAAIPFEERRLAHARSFLLTYAAFLAQYHAGLRLLRLTLGRRGVETLLDEAAPDLGLPEGQYANLKWNVLHVADVTKLLVGAAYLDLFRRDLRRDPAAAWTMDFVRKTLPRVRSHLAARAVGYFASNTISIFRRKLFGAWFPVQRGVARWMGGMMVKDHTPMITRKQAAALARRLLPGDILVERRSWHLSNVGLPGFWPHAALYVGTPDEMRRSLGAVFVRRLRSKHPRRFKDFMRKPFRVIEAVSPGVVFKTIEDSAHADYVGVLRPRRGVETAIERAFHYHGRPYDFDFDFTSDATLVCSELVYKCYQGAIRLPLVSTAGREVLPPNEIVRKFDREHGTPRQEMDFVCFLDGIEASGVAEFRKSHLRPRWDFLQK